MPLPSDFVQVTAEKYENKSTFFFFLPQKTVQISYQGIPPSGYYITLLLGLSQSLKVGTICVPGLCKQLLEQ